MWTDWTIFSIYSCPLISLSPFIRSHIRSAPRSVAVDEQRTHAAGLASARLFPAVGERGHACGARARHWHGRWRDEQGAGAVRCGSHDRMATIAEACATNNNNEMANIFNSSCFCTTCMQEALFVSCIVFVFNTFIQSTGSTFLMFSTCPTVVTTIHHLSLIDFRPSPPLCSTRTRSSFTLSTCCGCRATAAACTRSSSRTASFGSHTCATASN